jgi:hypothetical protein
MASAAKLMKSAKFSTGMHGLPGLAIDTAVGAGASYAIGRAHVRYKDKVYGKHAAKIAAAVGKGGAIIVSMLTGGDAGIGVGMLNSVGQSGVNAMALTYGLKHERKAQGIKAITVPEGFNTKSLPAASEVTAVGALGSASAGRGLSWDAVQELANAV